MSATITRQDNSNKQQKFSEPTKNGKLNIKNLRLKNSLKKHHEFIQHAGIAIEHSKILQTQAPGFLEPETELERTYRLSQEELKKSVNEISLKKAFNLSLPKFGPYTIDYSLNGRYVLLGGMKGYMAAFDIESKKILVETQVRETVKDVKWLHNHNLFAAAQKKFVYIYDNSGLELHCLRKHIEVRAMQFLPYHFLLATLGNSSLLKYQDISTGQLVAELRTKAYQSKVLVQNHFNAVLHVGHSDGSVSLWSPATPKPLAKVLCHHGPVTAISIDREGKYIVTAGLDCRLKIWDVRNFKVLYEYFSNPRPSSLEFSDTGLIAVGSNSRINIWKDAQITKQSRPYLSHIQTGLSVHALKFRPFEDILGASYDNDFSQLIVPGAGEANFDSYEINPYETRKQRREGEVRNLIEKLKPEMIGLEPNFIGDLTHTTVENATNNLERYLKPKTNVKGKNSGLRKALRKKTRNIIDQRKLRLELSLKEEKQMRQALKNESVPTEGNIQPGYGIALSRFAMRQKFSVDKRYSIN